MAEVRLERMRMARNGVSSFWRKDRREGEIPEVVDNCILQTLPVYSRISIA